MKRLRHSVVSVGVAVALLGLAGPTTADENGMVEQAECVGMTVRLEQRTTEHQYDFYSVAAGDCTWTHVSDVAQVVRRSATASFNNVFHDTLSGSGWPVICAGPAVGSWDVFVDAGGAGGSFWMDHGDAHLRHVNLGNGVSVLQVRGLHTGTRMVAGSGTFTRTAGGCGSTFVEFQGHMVVGDPPLPQI